MRRANEIQICGPVLYRELMRPVDLILLHQRFVTCLFGLAMLENIWIRVEFAQQFGFLFEEREGLKNPAAETHHENYHERIPEEITTVSFYFL